jgi:hypothetical protein
MTDLGSLKHLLREHLICFYLNFLMSYILLEDKMNKNNKIYLRNKSWKPECVWSWWILVF